MAAPGPGRATERVDDLATALKTTKVAHAAQLTKLQTKSQEELSLLDDIRNFLKRRAEIEATYTEEINRLVLQYQQARKRSPQERQSVKTWYTFLDETRSYAKSRAIFGEKLREEVVNPIKPYIDQRKRQFTLASEQCVKMQDSLQTALQDLGRAKQLYEQCFKDAERANAKYEEAMRAPTGTLKRFVSLSHTKAKLDEMRKRQKTSAQKAQNARNEYLLSVEAYRIHQQLYDTTLLPGWMRQVDGTFFESVAKNYIRFGEQETNNSRDLSVMAANIVLSAQKISRDQEYSDFIAESAPTFNAARPILIELAPTDKINSITCDDVSKLTLSKKLAQQMERRDQLEAALAKNQREQDALKKMTQVYDQTPAFGNASETQEEEDKLLQSARMLTLEKAKVEATIQILTGAGITAAAAAGGKKKVDGKAAVRKVIAKFDYEATMEGDLAIHTDDVITVIEDGPEWIKGELKGAIGFFPAAYVRRAEEPAGSTGGTSRPSKVQAMYDYNGEEGELSFCAGDIIEVTNKADDDWWEGRHSNGAVGSFPAVFVGELEDEDGGSSTTLDEGGSSGSLSSVGTGGSAPSFTSMFTPPTGAAGKNALPKAPSSGSISSLAQGAGANRVSVVGGATLGVNSGTTLQRAKSTTTAPPGGAAAAMTAAKAAGGLLAPMQAMPAPVAVAPTTSKKYFARALYDYQAAVDGELSFKKGEIIEVTNQDIGSEEWSEGRNSRGQSGQFPLVYVTPVAEGAAPPPSSTPKPAAAAAKAPAYPTAEVLYDYVAQDPVELSIAAGDIIEVVSKSVPDDTTGSWWEGRLKGRQGYFPKDYVNLK